MLLLLLLVSHFLFTVNLAAVAAVVVVTRPKCDRPSQNVRAISTTAVAVVFVVTGYDVTQEIATFPFTYVATVTRRDVTHKLDSYYP
jgi:hypothetical protein